MIHRWRGPSWASRASGVFELGYRGRSVTLVVREGFVTDEFIELARKEARSSEEESRLTELKREMAERVMAAPADDVYDAAPS